MGFIILLLLIFISGLFALAEIAIVSVRKSKLQKEANEGNIQAQLVLDLLENPSRFLSTVQIGITFIGIFTGAFGGETISHPLSKVLRPIPGIGTYSDQIAFFIVVAIITYLSLIIGELVPKRIALLFPEKTAKSIARPMEFLSTITAPLVNFLTFSSDVVIRLLHLKPPKEATVSEEEVNMLIQEGALTGVFNNSEKDIVERTFQLDDKKITSFMTHRKEIVWLDRDSSFKKLRTTILKHQHAYFPVCQDSLDTVLGVIRTEDLLASFLIDEKIDLMKSLRKPIYVPSTIAAWKVLEMFKRTGIHMAFVIDEYGSIVGLLSLSDILGEIIGDIPDVNDIGEQEIIKRKDGTFLVDGLITIDEFKKYFHVARLPDERSGNFHTIGGFTMDRLNRVPNLDDSFDYLNLRFKVASMDENRVDKILITRIEKSS